MRFVVLTPLLLLVSLAAVACGSSSSDDDPSPRRDSAAPTLSSATPSAMTRGPLDSASQCVGSRTSDGPLTRSSDLAAARTTALEAAARATATGHRFAVELDIVASRLRASAQVSGRRTPANASSALVVWRGVAGALLPDLGLRIVDDQLYLQNGHFDSPWRIAGSASGVSLDVGRELLDHPMLLTTTRARGDDAAMDVTFVAPADRLRAYATTERRGRVTDLLRTARQLTLVAQVRGGRLVGDRFTLVTTVPESLDLGPVPAGTTIRIDGASSYCPLRTVDRAPIIAPRVPR